jgi:hypothetical protein
MQRRQLLSCAVAIMANASLLQASQPGVQKTCPQDRTAWVGQVLTRMQSIKPGMTRKELKAVFTTEGGLSTGLQRTYISRDCPYFKLDVEFHAVGRPDRDANGRVTLVESDDDTIRKISTPYLQFSIMD